MLYVKPLTDLYVKPEILNFGLIFLIDNLDYTKCLWVTFFSQTTFFFFLNHNLGDLQIVSWLWLTSPYNLHHIHWFTRRTFLDWSRMIITLISYHRAWKQKKIKRIKQNPWTISCLLPELTQLFSDFLNTELPTSVGHWCNG